MLVVPDMSSENAYITNLVQFYYNSKQNVVSIRGWKAEEGNGMGNKRPCDEEKSVTNLSLSQRHRSVGFNEFGN